MRLGLLRFKRKRSASAQDLELVRSIFAKFRRIQKLNTRALELMAEMEQALGGEYIFDRAFLESSVRELNTLIHQVAYSLNAMSRNRYIDLFDCYQNIRSVLEDILAGGAGPFASHLTLPYTILGWELEPLVGALNVGLAEARLRLDLPAPDGFAITVAGCRLFLQENERAGTLSGGERNDLSPPEAVLPAALQAAITGELESLFARRGGPTALTVRVYTGRGHGESAVGINEVHPDDLLSACKDALCECARQLADRQRMDGCVAVAVHEAVAADLVGSIADTYSAELSARLLRVTAAPADAPQRTEEYLLRNIYPFDLVHSEVVPKACDAPVFPGGSPLLKATNGLYRGSALLEPDFLKSIAECAAVFERMLGCMPELHWARSKEEHQPVVLDIRPITASDGTAAAGCKMEEALAAAEVMLQGGQAVQTGIAAGCVVHVTDHDDPESFPHGAIIFTRVASPTLSPFLRRAAAIVTELGTSIGHLATIARELRVPGIFGMANALERIPTGMEVTVDAGERTIYRGIVGSLLACRECSTDLYPTDPEYAILRHLLRWIMPLRLIDPESSEFSVHNCRTYHDLLHFAHERSIEELLHIQDRGRDLAHLHARKIDLPIPLDLFVIDLGDGIAAQSGTTISPDEVRSVPFAAFLRGLASDEMWQRSPGSISMRDIFTGLDRTFAAMTNPPEYAGRNHAIVAENYMNLGLRLGYHFSVLDTYLGNSVNQNYIYFRFVGGFADEKRRRRRAELIRSILADLRFKVTVKGDLVVGKIKIAEQQEMITILVRLGELTGFTRQLDIAMASEAQVAELEAVFRDKATRDNSGEDGHDG